MKTKLIFLITILIMCSSLVYAQPTTVTGQIQGAGPAPGLFVRCYFDVPQDVKSALQVGYPNIALPVIPPDQIDDVLGDIGETITFGFTGFNKLWTFTSEEEAAVKNLMLSPPQTPGVVYCSSFTPCSITIGSNYGGSGLLTDDQITYDEFIVGPCDHYCGDMQATGPEQCDEMTPPPIPGETKQVCNPSCEWETVIGTGCGDGILEAGEDCDDGNFNSYDGCSSCQYELDQDVDGYYPCVGVPNENCDANDNDENINPETEPCNGVDDNGINGVDEGCDDDNDGYVDSDLLCDENAAISGEDPCLSSAELINGSDCSDESTFVLPGATELCDGRDNNCDGVIDEGCGFVSLDFERLYIARDGDRNINAMKEAKVGKTIIVMQFNNFGDNISKAVDDYYSYTGKQDDREKVRVNTEDNDPINLLDYNIISTDPDVLFWKSMTAKLRLESFKRN